MKNLKELGLNPIDEKQAESINGGIYWNTSNDYKTGRFSSMLPQYTTNKHARRHMERLNVMSPYWGKESIEL